MSAFRQGADTYHPLRKLRIAWAGIRHAMLLDFSVAYKLAVATVFLVLAAVTESALHFLVLLVVTALMTCTHDEQSTIHQDTPASTSSTPAFAAIASAAKRLSHCGWQSYRMKCPGRRSMASPSWPSGS